ncbi:hypothetical protein [Amycolatopsis sp. FDAARGOS 1241]|uniref:hypothetical protein n=1 Tax=Amycolatopsis sp. FDAARGOS 1241 TaxID=2778070 RepID=UPI00194FD859|nr:hypothetical protein [Amycolatopsis sp. FDAARGOS 1241]QRP49740.1 hypothetical protein I6J71_19565 [Amycolatopsis sp. FDAARGOS 1241]
MSVRRVAASRIAWGAVLLAASRVAEQPEVAAVLRILAVRHFVQAAVGLTWPDSVAARWAWLADSAHSLSMTGLAAASTRWRRPAVVNAVVAAAWASASRAASK